MLFKSSRPQCAMLTSQRQRLQNVKVLPNKDLLYVCIQLNTSVHIIHVFCLLYSYCFLYFCLLSDHRMSMMGWLVGVYQGGYNRHCADANVGTRHVFCNLPL